MMSSLIAFIVKFQYFTIKNGQKCNKRAYLSISLLKKLVYNLAEYIRVGKNVLFLTKKEYIRHFTYKNLSIGLSENILFLIELTGKEKKLIERENNFLIKESFR
ncbi:hypothetical protein BpHYR1_030109 [Brachionus plicatilis]|uniref:Uncharacterized protein n=1 Tax=Brachionus plicatilis TaxID=10195 RepID=A0A3M7PUE5_BRAPC|nr:hypothetical protein BpHYR1_030109 [Brachionus plicatilis]